MKRSTAIIKSEYADGTLRIPTPRVYVPLLRASRYKGVHGGRGSGKSHFFGESLVEHAITHRGLRAVCIREVQRSLEQSVKRLIEDKIRAMGVSTLFRVMESEIRTPGDGLIIFQGMQNHTADSIKSLEGYDIAWVEEAQTLSARSLALLRPTIRPVPGVTKLKVPELWFSWNPHLPDDPVDALLRGNDLPPGTLVVEANWEDNPWFPDVLAEEKDYDYRVDPGSAGHVWGGNYWTRTEAQVLGGKCRIEEFEPVTDGEGKWDGPYFGSDWGFSSDPTTLVKFWLRPDGGLAIEREAYRVGCDLLDTPALFIDAVPDLMMRTVRADNARPETISHMNRAGFRFIGAPKWKGSVEDGIAWLRGRAEIVIHPRCKHAIQESRFWSYKTDRLTGDVLPELLDGHDHIWDAVRYGAEPMIRTREWRPL